MARRLKIIAAGALGTTLFVAFLAVDRRGEPVPVAAELESPAVSSSKPTDRGDAAPIAGRAELVGAPDSGPVDEVRWSECVDAHWDDPPPALDGLGEGRTPPIVATLSASGSSEHVLAGALLRPQSDPGAILADLERALALDGDHPLVLWHADDLCGRGTDAPHCRSPDFIARVSSSLYANGALWMRRAVRNLERGNERAALDNVRRAAVAPEYDNFWAQHIVLFERALAIGGDLTSAQRTAVAVGVAAAIDGPGYRIFAECRDRSASDSLWMDACARLAARVAADSRTFLDSAISYDLLEDLYEQSGRHDAARMVARERAELESMLTADQDREVVLGLDDRFSSRWLDEVVANGEIAAMEFALAELERLRADPDYDPCALIVR